MHLLWVCIVYCHTPGKNYNFCPIADIPGASEGRNAENINAEKVITEVPGNRCDDQPPSQWLTVNGSSKLVYAHFFIYIYLFLFLVYVLTSCKYVS